MKDVKDKKPAKATSKAPRTEESNGVNSGNYSEQNDVPAAEKRGFPSVGNATTDFVSRPTGRRTGRMVGHEPGTDSL
jgi:hypothetical protein